LRSISFVSIQTLSDRQTFGYFISDFEFGNCPIELKIHTGTHSDHTVGGFGFSLPGESVLDGVVEGCGVIKESGAETRGGDFFVDDDV
jgi:hypothetical protein